MPEASIEQMKDQLFILADNDPESIIRNLSTEEAKDSNTVEAIVKKAFEQEIVKEK